MKIESFVYKFFLHECEPKKMHMPVMPLTIPSYERGVARLLRYDRHP